MFDLALQLFDKHKKWPESSFQQPRLNQLSIKFLEVLRTIFLGSFACWRKLNGIDRLSPPFENESVVDDLGASDKQTVDFTRYLLDYSDLSRCYILKET